MASSEEDLGCNGNNAQSGDLNGPGTSTRGDNRISRRHSHEGIDKGLGIRWHLILTYLFVIWVTTGFLILFLGRSFEESSIGARKSSLYAQAHLLASAVRARGGPKVARLTALGGVPFRGRVLLLDNVGRVLEDSAADPAFFGKTVDVPEVRAALSGKEAANTYYLPDGSFVIYVAVPSDWGGGGSPAAGVDRVFGGGLIGGLEGGPEGSLGAGLGDSSTKGAVFISQDLSDIVTQYKSIMRMAFFGGAITSIMAFAIALVFSSVVSNPLSEMARSARIMASGRLDARVEPKGPYEVRVLSQSFNDMAKSIEDMVRAQEDFLTAAAHELRGPLSSMMVLLESMQMKSPDESELPGLLKDLSQELGRLSLVSESILGLLRVRNAEYVKEKVEPKAIIEEAVADRKNLIADKNLRVALSVETGFDSDSPSKKDEASSFINNSTLFRLIVSNLVDNAIKFTQPGGKVSIGFYQEGSEFVLRVEDNGPGIPPEKVPLIFQRFYQADPSRKKGRTTDGTGLGLAIVKEACERTGGRIEVESQVGKGSIFQVRW